MNFPMYEALRDCILQIKVLQRSVLGDPAQAGAEGGCIITPDAELREKFRAKVNMRGGLTVLLAWGALSMSYVVTQELNYTKPCKDLTLCHPAGISVLEIANVT